METIAEARPSEEIRGSEIERSSAEVQNPYMQEHRSEPQGVANEAGETPINFVRYETGSQEMPEESKSPTSKSRRQPLAQEIKEESKEGINVTASADDLKKALQQQ